MIEDEVPRGGLDMKSTAVAGIMRAERTPRKMTYGREIGTVKNAAPITLHGNFSITYMYIFSVESNEV